MYPTMHLFCLLFFNPSMHQIGDILLFTVNLIHKLLWLRTIGTDQQQCLLLGCNYGQSHGSVWYITCCQAGIIKRMVTFTLDMLSCLYLHALFHKCKQQNVLACHSHLFLQVWKCHCHQMRIQSEHFHWGASWNSNSSVLHSARHQRPARERHKIRIASRENVDSQAPHNLILHISTFRFTFKCGYNDFQIHRH